MVEWTAEPPRQVVATRSLEGIEVTVMHRFQDDPVRLRVLLFGGFILAAVSAIALAVVGPELGFHPSAIGVLPVLLSLISVVGLLVRSGQQIWRGQVGIDQHMVRIQDERHPLIELPLEAIQTVQIETRAERGRLRFITAREELILFDGLFVDELEWLAALVQHHAIRQRQQLRERGQDPDQAVAPPESIQALVRRR